MDLPEATKDMVYNVEFEGITSEIAMDVKITPIMSEWRGNTDRGGHRIYWNTDRSSLDTKEDFNQHIKVIGKSIELIDSRGTKYTLVPLTLEVFNIKVRPFVGRPDELNFKTDEAVREFFRKNF